MSTVVSDASPLINLARVERFDLLRARGTWIGYDLYTDVLRQAGEIE